MNEISVWGLMEIYFNNDVPMLYIRWFSTTNIYLAKQYLNQNRLKTAVMLIIPSIFLLA